MQTHDINGTEQGRNYQGNVAAGVRTGSPKVKNESSVFSHLQPDGSERDGLKRKDLFEIPKPKVVPNNLSQINMQRLPSNNGYDLPPMAPALGYGAPYGE